MTDQQFDQLFKFLTDGIGAHNHAMKIIAESVVQIEHNMARMISAGPGNSSPNYYKRLSDFGAFDWSSIGASVVDEDRDGVSVVDYEGRMFTRRRGHADFDPVIYFSVCTGKNEKGDNQYNRLITFKEPGKAKRVPEETKELLEAKQASRSQPVPQRQQQRETQPARTQQPEVRQDEGGVACGLKTWDRFNGIKRAAEAAGVTEAQWKEKVARVCQSDQMESLDDAAMAKAITVIVGLTNEALQGRKAVKAA